MRTLFLFEKVKVESLPWVAETVCLNCGEPFVVRRGAIAPVLRAGNEVVGVMCDECLAPESRAEVERRRKAEVSR